MRFRIICALLLSITVIGNSSFSVMAKAFPDVPLDHLHKKAIEEMSDEGIIQGYPDGNFQPDKTINRVEFLKILIEAKGDYSPNTDPSSFDIYSLDQLNYKDLEEDQWYLPYIRYATQNDIVTGYPDRTFKPAKSINLAEALKIIFQTFQLPTVKFIKEPDQWYEYYTGALEADFKVQTKLSAQSDIAKELTRGEVASLIVYFREKALKLAPGNLESIAPALISEPLLLERTFAVREQIHTVTGYIMYPTTCGKPKPNIIIDDSTIPEQIVLEILEDEPKADLKKCEDIVTEQTIVFSYEASHNSPVNEVIAYGNQVEFIIHDVDKEISHPNAPLVLHIEEDIGNDMVFTQGLIYGNSSCDKAEATVYEYAGLTHITQLEVNTVSEGESCVGGLVELLFNVNLKKNTIIRGRINGQPISITFEKESIEAFRERSRTLR